MAEREQKTVIDDADILVAADRRHVLPAGHVGIVGLEAFAGVPGAVEIQRRPQRRQPHVVDQGRLGIGIYAGQVDDLRPVGAAERPAAAQLAVVAVVVIEGAHRLGLPGQHPVADARAQMGVPQLIERRVLVDDAGGVGEGRRRGRRQVQPEGDLDVGGVAADIAHRQVRQDRNILERRVRQGHRVQDRLALADHARQLARRLSVDIALDGRLLIAVALLPVIGACIGRRRWRAVFRQGCRSSVFRMQGDVDFVGDDRVDQSVEP